MRTVFALRASFVALLALLPRVASGQDAAAAGSKILSSEIAISRERAEIKLELEGGQKVTLATVAGAPRTMQRSGVAGDEIITMGVSRGDAIDRSWRELLNAAMDAQPADLGTLLAQWDAPGATGIEFDHALEAAVGGIVLGPPVAPPAPVAPGMNDSVVKLESRIEQLQEQLEDARGDAINATSRNRGPDWLAPLRHVSQGITSIFALLVTFAVLFGIGFLVVMFGGRKYIEAVADTAREGMGRSFLVGLAGSFLLLPVFVLGVIALAISIVGIPALLVWVPLFPVATVAAALLGYLAVAHATGESWAERRYYGSEWFSRANSYYFMASGLGLLASLFIAAAVVHMAGPWLGFINGVLNFFGIVLTWIAATIGFGAVLISRAGTRTTAAMATDTAPLYTEQANV